MIFGCDWLRRNIRKTAIGYLRKYKENIKKMERKLKGQFVIIRKNKRKVKSDNLISIRK